MNAAHPDATQTSDHRLILSSRVNGTAVFQATGERIGHVDDLSIEKRSGRVIYAIMSWLRSDTPITDIIDRLCAPLLRPLRRVIPLAGGIDLTPLVFLVLLQVAAIVLAAVQRGMLH